MEISKRRRTPQLEVPELIQMIQSLLPAKEAARTMVLSKSWLHAWSTRPIIGICVTKYSFKLPDSIFSCENLHTISVQALSSYYPWIPAIKCVSLRVLELLNVSISQDVLDNILSACTLLEKANYDERYRRPFSEREYLGKALSFTSDSFESMKQLCLRGVIMNHTFLDIINSKFPFLESLTIDMVFCSMYRVDITCVSLKRLILMLEEDKVMVVQVYATKLLFFRYVGTTMPNLSFPTGAHPQEIEIKLKLSNQVCMPFFIQIREALKMSSKFNIEIVNMSEYCAVPCNINVDDLKTSVKFPATNVEEMSLEGCLSNHLWEDSSLFDAFISICHPNYVKVSSINSNCFWKRIVEAMIKRRTSQSDLKDVEIKSDSNGRWETLRYAPISSLDKLKFDPYTAIFKLIWCSP